MLTLKVKLITLMCTILLIFSSLPAYASLYSGYYTFSASSPLSGPSMSDVTATPGMVINLQASVCISYNGFVPIPVPSFNVNTVYTLQQNGATIDTQTDSIPINGRTIYSGHTYNMTSYSKYTVPSGIAPGFYTLYCVANVNVPLMGSQTYSNTFTVNVVNSASYPAYSSTTGGNAGVTGQDTPGGNQNGYSDQNSQSYQSNSASNPVYNPTAGGNTAVTGQNPPNGVQNGYADQKPQTSALIHPNFSSLIIIILTVFAIALVAGAVWYWRKYQPLKIPNDAKNPGVNKAINQKYGLTKNRAIIICVTVILVLTLGVGAGVYLGLTPNGTAHYQNPTDSKGQPTIMPSVISPNEPTLSPTTQPATFSFYGVVRDYSGAPVDNAQVTLLQNGVIVQTSDNPQYSTYDVTLGHGAYKFDNVPEGTYEISADMDGYEGSIKTGGYQPADVFLQPNNQGSSPLVPTSQSEIQSTPVPTVNPTPAQTPQPTVTGSRVTITAYNLHIDYTSTEGYFGPSDQVLSSNNYQTTGGKTFTYTLTLTSTAAILEHKVISASITTPGFTGVSVSPDLPSNYIAPGSSLAITLTVRAPSNSYTGPLDIQLKT